MRRSKAATRHSLEQDGFGTGFPWAFSLLSAVGSRGLEHRAQDAEPGVLVYKPRRKSIMAAPTSGARSCSVQWPQPGSQPADRRINWRSDSACSRIEPGTTKAGVSTLG